MGVVEVGQYVYYFLRELALELGGKFDSVAFARVVRLCKVYSENTHRIRIFQQDTP